MRILFVGILDVEYSTNCSMKRELENMGHEIIPFNYRTVAKEYMTKKSHTIMDRWIDKGASFLRSSRMPFNFSWYFLRNGRKEMNQLLFDDIKKNKYDLVFLSKPDLLDYKLVSEFRRYAPVWYYFMDPIDQAIRINARAYAIRSTWASATFSDVTKYFKKSDANAYWITQGVDAEIFKPEKTEKIYDVVFVGSKDEHKREQYIDYLKKNRIKVTCFGKGWENKSVYQEQLVDIYRKSRVVLNFCREGKGFSIRVFQVMGTGTFMLSEYCSDIDVFFRRGEHLDFFETKEEMLLKIKKYLKDENQREEIAQNGCRLVHSDYSWTKKMKDIDNILKKSIKNV